MSMIRAILISVVSLIFLTEGLALKLTPVVQTKDGPIQGQILETVWHSKKYSSFRHVPFAHPPTGNRRFKAPIKPAPWTDVLNATQEGPSCIQSASPGLTGSEDCLYLNVYTPETQFDCELPSRTVMVWIYGGAFLTGTKNASMYGPDFFLERDIVVVAMNYRVGALGFLSLDYPGATGNNGLKDQAFALKWVKENIAQFGGNPNSVTIFGQSAGGASVSFQLLSKNSKELFHRAISMSGTALCPWAYQSPEQITEQAFKLGSLLGSNTTDKGDLLEFLHSISADKIVTVTEQLGTIIPPFAPTLENASIAEDIFLTECPIKLFESGRFNHGPYMLGFAKDEIISFLANNASVNNIRNYTESVIDSVAYYDSNHHPNSNDSISALNNTLNESFFNGTKKVGTIILFTSAIDLTQRLVSKNNDKKPVYYYRSDYDNPKYSVHRNGGVEIPGVGHGDDLLYIFNIPRIGAPTDPNDPFNKFRSKVVRLWSNFARYGDPNGAKRRSRKVLWKNSGHLGLQLNINLTFALKHRLLDNTTQSFEIPYSESLPHIKMCADSDSSD